LFLTIDDREVYRPTAAPTTNRQ